MGSGRTMFEGLEAWTGPAAIAELDAASGARARRSALITEHPHLASLLNRFLLRHGGRGDAGAE